jgi:SAM-dependent methyltransferase
MNDWWKYDNLPRRAPYDWSPAQRGDHEYDALDFHLDLGCGVVPKARLGIDRHRAPGVDLLINLETLAPPVPFSGTDHDASWARTMEQFSHVGEGGFGRLPFPDSSIESIISHHCLEHIGDGFVRVMDECHRVLKPGGIFRIIVPLFPSKAAVEDPDHRRYFMEETFETFCGASDGSHWHESFSVPYTTCRFQMVHKDITPGVKPPESWGNPDVEGIEPHEAWGPKDVREIRVALRKWSLEEVAQHGDQIHEGRRDGGGDELALGGGSSESGRGRELAGVA